MLVCLHQTASSSRMYEAFMTRARSDYQLIALDTPGFGGSPALPEAPSIGDLVEVLSDAVAALGHSAYHLLGHHTGAAIACEWAATHPENVRSLAMIGALAMGPEERERWLQGVEPAPIREDGSHLTAAWQRVANIDAQPVQSPPDPELRHREAVDVLLATPRWPEAYRAVFTQDFERHYAAVRCPILLMCGPEDVLWPYFDRTAELRPDAHAVELPGGAYVLDQQPEAVLSALREFHSSLAVTSQRL